MKFEGKTTSTRRAIMRGVRSRDTAPEVAIRRALWRAGLRYRVNARQAGARPDVSFPAARVAVFVDGCFWHGCPEHYRPPKENVGFWAEKIARTRARDAADNARLEAAGWTVLRFWDCDVQDDVSVVISRVRDAVRAGRAHRDG